MIPRVLSQEEVFNRLPLTAEQKKALYAEIMAEYHAQKLTACDDASKEEEHKVPEQTEPN